MTHDSDAVRSLFRPALVGSFLFSCGAVSIACGPDEPSQGVAHVISGATDSVGRDARDAGDPADGEWRLSPDRVEVTIESLAFEGEDLAGDTIDLDDCTVTYDRTEPSLSEISACSFELAQGTYHGMRVMLTPRMWVTVEDSANGFYTDGVGLVTDPPAGGVVPSPFDSMQVNILSPFVEPLVVTEAPVEVSVVMSGVHTINVQVQDGTVTYQADSFVVLIFGSATTPGAVSHYSSSGTASSRWGDTIGLSLFYEDALTPTHAFLWSRSRELKECTADGFAMGAYNRAPGPTDGSGNRVGGYLGRDGTGTICFALPTDLTYATYRAVYRMPELAQIGGPTTLSCVSVAADPAPVSGSTYASGCPQFAPEADVGVFLVAE